MIKSHKKIVGGIVSPEDLELLKAIEDRYDRRAARAALARIETEGTVPAEDLFRELGL